MGLAKDYKTDNAKEIDGVEVRISENDDGTVPTFMLSRMGKSNKRYTKAFEAATRPYRRQIELKTLGEKTAEDMLRKVFCDTILLGWANIQNEKVNGVLLFPEIAENANVPFNVENALSLFETLPELYDELSAQASDVSLFRAAVVEDEAKN